MRPYLRRGAAVGQRRPPPKPIALVLCTCVECADNNMAFDPVAGKMVPGRLIGRQMAIFHRRHGGSVPRTRDDDIPAGTSTEPIQESSDSAQYVHIKYAF